MRVALVGEGGLPGPEARDTRFCTLRLAQYHAALAGHDVRLVDCRAPVDPGPVDAVVSAGIYGPTKVALALAGDRPLWLDLPGDPFADAQAWAWATGGEPDRVEEAARDAAAVFLPALRRADRVAAVSGPSRLALIGALGAVGRTVRTPPGEELVVEVPVAYAFGGLPEAAPRVEGTPPRVLLAGSLNTWFDVRTALEGILRAMDRGPLEAEVLGGGVPGHHSADEEWLRARILGSRHARRFRLHGWLPERELSAVTARCTVGLCLDRPGYEPEMGSRTRVLFFLHQGLPVVATPRTELVRALVGEGFVTPVPVGDADAVATALLAPRPLPDRRPVRERWSTAATTRALREWAVAPARARRG